MTRRTTVSISNHYQYRNTFLNTEMKCLFCQYNPFSKQSLSFRGSKLIQYKLGGIGTQFGGLGREQRDVIAIPGFQHFFFMFTEAPIQ
jgi:hypothetical protein